MGGRNRPMVPAVSYQRPPSPKDELDGIVYFPRLCGKVRLHAAGKLHPDYQSNLGCAMDLWTCEFLGVAYEDLKEQILKGVSDEDCLAWARAGGASRTPLERKWWHSYLLNRGFRDDLSERLVQRKAESGLEKRGDILTFMDYIDADDALIEEQRP
jgi:gluconokinase